MPPINNTAHGLCVCDVNEPITKNLVVLISKMSPIWRSYDSLTVKLMNELSFVTSFTYKKRYSMRIRFGVLYTALIRLFITIKKIFTFYTLIHLKVSNQVPPRYAIQTTWPSAWCIITSVHL